MEKKEEEIGQEKANKKGYSKRKKGVEKMEEHYTLFFYKNTLFFSEPQYSLKFSVLSLRLFLTYS